jgi:hypothetical protein
MKRLAMVLAVVGLMASWAGSAIAFNIAFAPGDYDNTANTVTGTNASPVYNNNQTTGTFRDVFWWGTAFNGGTAGVASPDFINSGPNLISNGGSPARAIPGGNDNALNFTGIRTSGGASLLAIYDTTPGDGTATTNVFDATGGLTLSADVLFAPGNHNASGGVVALYNSGQDGLALLANNGGGSNADVPKLVLVFQHNGAPTTLTSISLDPDGGSGGQPFLGDTNGSNPNLGDHWYRIVMFLSVIGDTWTVNGSFFNHVDPENPNSALGSLIANLTFSGSVSNPDLASLHLTNPGEIGLMAYTPESFGDLLAAGGTGANPGVDNMGVSLTNFSNTPVPEPATMFLGGAGLLLLGYVARRRLFAR